MDTDATRARLITIIIIVLILDRSDMVQSAGTTNIGAIVIAKYGSREWPKQTEPVCFTNVTYES